MPARLTLPLLLLAACSHVRGDDSAVLRFSESGAEVATFSLGDLRRRVASQRVEAFDPYYQRRKAWEALPLEPVLALAFPGRQLASLEFTLRASDGYTVPVSGARLLEGGAFLAFADADGAWEPIGAQRASPAPWYLVWTGSTQGDPTTHPRPWALATIAIEDFEAVYPLVVPASKDPQVRRGYALFREQCFRCHAVNQQGGRVGPELNVPRSITEYRDEAFLRAWIRNPGAFRVSAMPPSPHLSEDELSALLAYLVAMKGQKIAVEAPGGH
jgi:mono/diheme cytochrome c family protein